MVLRSQSVGEQDVADQQGAFFCAGGGSRSDGLKPLVRPLFVDHCRTAEKEYELLLPPRNKSDAKVHPLF